MQDPYEASQMRTNSTELADNWFMSDEKDKQVQEKQHRDSSKQRQIMGKRDHIQVTYQLDEFIDPQQIHHGT